MSIFKLSEDQESQAPIAPDPVVTPEIEQKMKRGASWFYWIAALSLVNSFVSIAGGQWNFIVGLGVTQIIDALLYQMSGGEGGLNGFTVVALMLDVLVAGVFVMFGFFAGKGSIAMFITGIVIYILDALLYLFAGDMLAAGFHAFALFFMVSGLIAAFQFRKAVKNTPMIQS